jgi:hypothetical protein
MKYGGQRAGAVRLRPLFFFLPLFTGVRGRGVLRTSAVKRAGRSQKIPALIRSLYSGHSDGFSALKGDPGEVKTTPCGAFSKPASGSVPPNGRGCSPLSPAVPRSCCLQSPWPGFPPSGPFANAGMTLAIIIAAKSNASVSTLMMRCIYFSPPFCYLQLFRVFCVLS